MNDKKIITLIIFLSLAVLIGGVVFLSRSTTTSQISASANAKAYVKDPTSFDWGNIPMYKGNVIKKFSLKNEGTDALTVFNVKTSCHCTVARVSVNGKESQNFGMSGVSSWMGEIAPGKEAEIIAEFDPAFHGSSGVGPITRFVSIETNDKGNSKITFTLTGTVIK